jgi:hypothetical protein
MHQPGAGPRARSSIPQKLRGTNTVVGPAEGLGAAAWVA